MVIVGTRRQHVNVARQHARACGPWACTRTRRDLCSTIRKGHGRSANRNRTGSAGLCPSRCIRIRNKKKQEVAQRAHTGNNERLWFPGVFSNVQATHLYSPPAMRPSLTKWRTLSPEWPNRLLGDWPQYIHKFAGGDQGSGGGSILNSTKSVVYSKSANRTRTDTLTKVRTWWQVVCRTKCTLKRSRGTLLFVPHPSAVALKAAKRLLLPRGPHQQLRGIRRLDGGPHIDQARHSHGGNEA